ncbi:MAG: 4Fe-4S binding protein [Candidatus Omnitrophica bacterium]|nr:4Fe-4S binding protein [Candidatus Omnitrophota bacterium]
MQLYGVELLRGLGITFSHFVRTYVKGVGRKFAQGNVRQLPTQDGIFTVPYPEEKLAVPERLRVLPFLIYNGNTGQPATEESIRCTACGICAKVCPPQCIWIVQAKDAVAGKPKPKPAEFTIDMDVCMNCGFCSEYCPFDAIKMGHDFELSNSERDKSHIFEMDRLLVPTENYAKTHPGAWAEEEAKRQAAAAKKAATAAAAAAAAKPAPGTPP